MTSRKASIVRDSCRNKSPGNRKSPHFFRKKFGNRWSSSGEHIVIRIRWSRFKSFRPVVYLQNNLLHINSPFQDLLMLLRVFLQKAVASGVNLEVFIEGIAVLLSASHYSKKDYLWPNSLESALSIFFYARDRKI